jgi:hypothetical protein
MCSSNPCDAALNQMPTICRIALDCRPLLSAFSRAIAMDLKKITYATAIIALASSPANAQGGPNDPRVWLGLCSSDVIESARLCRAYLHGYLGGHAITMAMTLPNKVGLCIPEGTTVDDIRKIVLAYSQRELTQELLDQPFFSTNMLIYQALAVRFPCPRTQEKSKQK